MRRILTILAFFSTATLFAQPLRPTEHREQPRSLIRPYATADEAISAPVEHRYGAVVDGWQPSDEGFRSHFTVPFAWTNRQVLMRVRAASSPYAVWINGKQVAYNADGNAAADFNITKFVREGRNEVEIRLDTTSPVLQLEGWKADAQAALDRVELLSPPTMGIREVLLNTRRIEQGMLAEVGIVVKSYALNPRSVRIYYELLDPNGESVKVGHGDLTLQMRGEDTLRFVTTVADSLAWSADRPQHHTLRLRTQREGRNMEYHAYQLGMRTTAIEDNRLLINGKPLAWDPVACGANVTTEQLVALKEAGKRLIQLPAAAAARSEEIYAACDTLGLYLLAPTPIHGAKMAKARTKGGSLSNDPQWRETYLERTTNAYHAAKRHPSVVGFTLGEQAGNGICLYESYLTMKRLETQRPILYFDCEGEWNHDPMR